VKLSDYVNREASGDSAWQRDIQCSGDWYMATDGRLLVGEMLQAYPPNLVTAGGERGRKALELLTMPQVPPLRLMHLPEHLPKVLATACNARGYRATQLLRYDTYSGKLHRSNQASPALDERAERAAERIDKRLRVKHGFGVTLKTLLDIKTTMPMLDARLLWKLLLWVGEGRPLYYTKDTKAPQVWAQSVDGGRKATLMGVRR
jgi:hypothetical protein